MRFDPQYPFTHPAACAPVAPRRWPAHVAPAMDRLRDLALTLSHGRAAVSLERLPDDPVLRISLGGDRRGLEALRGALLESLSDGGFEEIEPGLLQDVAGGSLVGVGAVAADSGMPILEVWGLDGAPAQAAPAVPEMEAVP